MNTTADKAQQLIARIEGYGPCVVALSGGVDSAVVAMAAYLAHREHALAVTGQSASLASGELEIARQVAAQIGIRHEVLETAEFNNPLYVRNEADRCYHCKTELYTQLESISLRWPQATIVNGANADDAGDYRPGMRAASEHAVHSPLLECGFDKKTVRELAAYWHLPVSDKPAAPCLSSRIAYGEEVTPERLSMVDRGERLLRSLGLTSVRVRFHRDNLARLEVPADQLAWLCEPGRRESLVAELKAIGFRYVTLDIEGFRSGSMNEVLPVESLRRVER